MSHRCIALVIATASVFALAAFTTTSQAQARKGCRQCADNSGQPDLFYNYYVGGGMAGGYPAAMYLSPRPTPPLVGHTYLTYQPFSPHEFMYRHRRFYTNVHRPGGVTRTKIWYR